MSLLRRALSLAFTIALIPGCSLFSSSTQPPAPLPQPTGALKPANAWSLSLGSASGPGFVPVLAAGSVWAAASDGTVARVAIETGQLVWRIQAGKPLTAGVGSDGTLAVVATRDGELRAFDAQGKAVWTAPVGAEVVTAPAVADGTVVVRASDNRVLAFEAATGKRLWNYQRQNPPLVLRNAGGIALIPGTAFIGMPGGRLVALALNNGAPRWDVALAQPRGANELERIADVVGSPLVIGREICAVAYQGRIGCFELATGRLVWSQEFSSATGFDIDDLGLVSVDADDRVQAFDRRGQPGWRMTGFDRRRLSAPFISGSAIALGDREGRVLWLARTGGALAAVTTTDGKPIVAPPVGVQGTVVVQTTGGALHAWRLP
ncbi:MAG: outer membrane protein assembly factor BamB [Burkholderiaceae bacterium]